MAERHNGGIIKLWRKHVVVERWRKMKAREVEEGGKRKEEECGAVEKGGRGEWSNMEQWRTEGKERGEIWTDGVGKGKRREEECGAKVKRGKSERRDTEM